MQVADSRMIASVGFWMVGSARSSTWTAPGAVITATRMDRLLDIGNTRAGWDVHVPPLGSSQPRPERMRKSLSRRVLAGHPKRRRQGRTADDVDTPRSVSPDLAVIQPHSARRVGLPGIGVSPAMPGHFEQICWAVRLLGEDRRMGGLCRGSYLKRRTRWKASRVCDSEAEALDAKLWPEPPRVSGDDSSTSISPSATMTPSPSPTYRTTRALPPSHLPLARPGAPASGQWCS